MIEKVSYSSLIQFKNCPHQFRLNNIDKVGKFDSTIHTVFGKYIHEGVQSILQKNGDEQTEISLFERRWKKFSGIFREQLLKQVSQATSVDDMGLAGSHILSHVRSVIGSEFKAWTVVSIEQRLRTPDLYSKGKHFKGFIDIVLKFIDDKGKEKYVVIDFKTCSSVYWFKQNQDKYKEAQLVFYKHFFCQESKVPEKDVETYFVLLEKNHKSKNPVVCVRVTSGKVKIANCLAFLEKSIGSINLCEEKNYFPKNRVSCYNMNGVPQCPFFGTKHCSSSI